MIQPKISVLLTSYNHEKYLCDAIESVLNQTFSDFELIIWDDASTDSSWKIINSYKDRRIRAFQNKTNQMRGSLNKMIQIANGEYLAVHHSDDMWQPTKLEIQTELLNKNPQFGAVFSDAQLIDEENLPFQDKTHVNYGIFTQPNRSRHQWLNHFFYKGNALCHPSLLIRKTCFNSIGTYRNGFVNIDDFDLWVRLCLKYEIFVIPEKLVCFRILRENQNSSADRPDTRIRSNYGLLKILDHYREIPDITTLKKIFPESGQFLHKSNPDLLFALGMVAVKFGTNNPTKLFGLNLLFEAVDNPNRLNQLIKFQKFDQRDFYELQANYDVFSTEPLHELQQRIDKLE